MSIKFALKHSIQRHCAQFHNNLFPICIEKDKNELNKAKKIQDERQLQSLKEKWSVNYVN